MSALDAARVLWGQLGGSAGAFERTSLTGPDHVLPSPFDVTSFAAASVLVATMAAGELLAARTGEPAPTATSEPVSWQPRTGPLQVHAWVRR